MKKIILSTVACATMMLAANADYKYEITPMIGGTYTEGNLGLDRNYANAGLAVGFNQTDSIIDQVELGFLRTIEDVEYENAGGRDTSVTRIFANLVKEYSLSSDFSLYALAGAGVELFDDAANNNNNEDGLFGNYGVGAKYKISENFALKADLRHLIETDSGDNNLLYTVGLAIPFGKVAKAAPVVAPVVMAPKDSDNDGVIDANDKCPSSVANAVVDAMGCEMDDDKDGVVNRLDNCPSTMMGAQVDTVGCMTLVNLNINFDTNSAVIKDSYNSKIVNFANVLKNNSKLNATIEAHTDSRGSAKYNQKLSEKRAAATVEALKALNIDSSRLNTVGYGEAKPVTSNMLKEGRAQNRRVTAVINK